MVAAPMIAMVRRSLATCLVSGQAPSGFLVVPLYERLDTPLEWTAILLVLESNP